MRCAAVRSGLRSAFTGGIGERTTSGSATECEPSCGKAVRTTSGETDHNRRVDSQTASDCGSGERTIGGRQGN
jgi:hypothetical protein